jgi:hypothetical protein
MIRVVPGKKILDPGSGSTSKNVNILTQIIVSKLSENMIRVVHPGSGSGILIFYPSRIQGSKRHRIRIRNTADDIT